MKKLIICFSLITTQIALGQKQLKKYKWPGFVQLNDSVFISKTEISIRDYAEFLHTMKLFLGSYEKFEDALPYPNNMDWVAYVPYSTISINGNLHFGELYTVLDSTDMIMGNPQRGLNRNVAYTPFIQNCPVVNITKSQALLYCENRTKAFPTLYKNTKKEKKWHLPDSVYFRLPTEKEWLLASTNDSIEFEQNIVVSKTYYDRLNRGEHIPLPVYAGNKNSLGLMNMCGNVAEMVMDTEFIYGGSYLDPLSECKTTSKSSSEAPGENIGFRIVAVIIKK